MATENRYVRIEDWKGNVYYPESSSAKSTAGSISDSTIVSTTDPTADSYTQGQITVDTQSNSGKAIKLASGSSDQILYRTLLSGISFGNISINIRLKSSKVTPGTTNLIKVNTYFVDRSGTSSVETLLDTNYIDGNAIGKINEYVNVGTVTEFKGSATGQVFLKVELILLKNTGATISFDQLAVAMALPSVSDGKVYVEGEKIIVP